MCEETPTCCPLAGLEGAARSVRYMQLQNEKYRIEQEKKDNAARMKKANAPKMVIFSPYLEVVGGMLLGAAFLLLGAALTYFALTFIGLSPTS